MAKLGGRTAGIGVIVAVAVMAIIVGLVLPVGVDALMTDDSTTIDQEEGVEDTVTTHLNTTATTIDDTDNEVTVQLDDTDTGSTTTTTVAEGTSETVTMEGEEITVTVDSIDSSTTATLTYDYPSWYGWGDGAQSLVQILDLIFILTILLVTVGWAVASF